tara:strand:+ start:1972 stop:3453 length:1482 start_codon:yes stop_codon:yes gene_type:complete
VKLLLVYINEEYRPMVPINLTGIESYVKKSGHEVKVFDTSFYEDIMTEGLNKKIKSGSYQCIDYSHIGIKINNNSSSQDLLKLIEDYQPDLIGFSVYVYGEKKADLLAQAIKTRFSQIPIIYGGPQTTLQSERIIKQDWVDIICRGEGEKALLSLCNAIEAKTSFDHVPNLWVKKNNGTIIKNNIGSFIDPNEIPVPDWSNYDPKHFYGPIEGKIYKLATVEYGRGCPYKCSYCEGVQINKIYSDAGIKGLVRHKSPDRFVDECVYLVKNYGIDYFYIVDGTFLTMSTSHLKELAQLYKEKVNRPFLCLTTVNSITEERAQLLKKMNCDQVNIGVEAGGEQYRKDVLNRPNMSDEMIVNALELLRKYGIKTSTYNMIGLPWQDRNDVFNTIRLLRKANPDYIKVSIFVPYESTPLVERLRKEGYILEDQILGEGATATVKVPCDMTLEEIQGLYRTFILYCRAPIELYPLITACEEESKENTVDLEKLKQIWL